MIGVNVANQGVPIGANPHSLLNFSGGGVTAFDNGGGEAKAVIPLTGPLFWGALDVGPLADTRFLGPGQSVTASLADVQGLPLPFNTILRNLFVRHNLAAGNGASVVYTVILNGAPTALTVTLATGAVGTAADTSNSVGASAGDTLSIQADKPAIIADGLINAFVTLLLD